MALLTAERRSSAPFTSPLPQCWNCSTRQKEDGDDDDDDVDNDDDDDDDDDDDGDDGGDS